MDVIVFLFVFTFVSIVYIIVLLVSVPEAQKHRAPRQLCNGRVPHRLWKSELSHATIPYCQRHRKHPRHARTSLPALLANGRIHRSPGLLKDFNRKVYISYITFYHIISYHNRCFHGILFYFQKHIYLIK